MSPAGYSGKYARNIVVFSDTHCGCRLGLCPPEGVALDDGGTYKPSRPQVKVWAYYLEFRQWVKKVTKGEPFDLVMNGDALDGVHHNSVTQISHNLKDQHAIAVACLLPFVQECRKSGGSYFHIRGTEAHVGRSAQEEERLAQSLGATPNDEGQFARWELWKRVGGQNGGHLCHFLHHISTTGSAAYESTALHKELIESFVEAGRWGDEPPQVIVRSHRHRHFETRIAVGDGYGIATVTPAWQLKTPFTYKIPGARLAQPQFGGILIRAGDEELHTRFFVRRIERPKEE